MNVVSGPLQNECKSHDLIEWARSVRRNAVKLRALAAAQRTRIPADLPVLDGNRTMLRRDPLDEPSSVLAPGIVTIGGSAGAIRTTCVILATLPDAFQSAIVIALHGAMEGDLVRILQRCSTRPVRWAIDDESLRMGCTYVAPPHCHVIINPDARLCVSHAPRIRCFRPSVDWLFESASATFEDRHIAVVLSGRLNDGAAGVRSVTRLGGVVMAEEPAASLFGAMPQAAIQTGCVKTVLPGERLAAAILGVSGSGPSFRGARTRSFA